MAKFHLLLIIVIMIFLSSCKKEKASNCNCNEVIIPDRYEYLVKSGTPEWNAAGAAGGLDSLYKLCQIPQSRLQNTTTIGVIHAIETNPCLGNILLRINLFQGRNEVLTRLNVYLELCKRNDVNKIMEYYLKKNPCCVETMQANGEKGDFSAKWVLFDLVCTDDSLIKKLQPFEKKQFAKTVLEKYNLQLKYPDVYGLSKTTSTLLLSQLMKSYPYSPYINSLQTNSDLSMFAYTTQVASPDILDQVLSFAKEFINP